MAHVLGANVKRSKRLTSTARLARKGRLKPANATRRRDAFARCYGSKERVRWVKSLPCWLCGRVGLSENAHVENDGKSRKADADKIIPLCGGPDGCHGRFDQYKAPFRRDSETRAMAKRFAATVERMWQGKMQPLHTTDPLCVTCGASFREDGEQCASCAYQPCDSDC